MVERLGIDGLIRALVESNYEPIGIHFPEKYITSITAPNFKKKKNGKIILQIPDEVFDNTENTRKFNQGKIKFVLLFVEDIGDKK